MLSLIIVSEQLSIRDMLFSSLAVPNLPYSISLCRHLNTAVSIASQKQVDIIIHDCTIEPASAIETTKKILHYSGAKVIVVSNELDPKFSGNVIAAGALGFLTEFVSNSDIRSAVSEVANNRIYNCTRNYSIPAEPTVSLIYYGKEVEELKKTNNLKLNKSKPLHWHNILCLTN